MLLVAGRVDPHARGLLEVDCAVDHLLERAIHALLKHYP